MLLEIIITIIAGILLGVLCGLLPGLHPNTVNVILLSLSPFLLQFMSPLTLAVLIIVVSVSNSIIDSVPSIYLGAPDTDGNVMSVLPGHQMLLRGEGHEAVILTVIGSIFGLVAAVLAIPPLALILQKIYPLIQNYIVYVLIITVIFLIFREKDKVWAFFIFILSGVLGIATLSSPLKEPLFPLFSGLFGISMLLLGLKNKVKIPKQKFTEAKIKSKTIFKAVLTSLISGSIVSMLPGLGNAQAAILGSSIVKDKDPECFLIMVGGINTVNFIISFISILILDKARNGSIVAVSELLEIFTINHLILFIIVSLISGGLSVLVTIKLSKVFSSLMPKISYQKLSLFIIIGITIAVIILSGFLGLLVLITATSLGMIPQFKNIGKNHLMGSLLLPVILYFLL
ncbi:tripartite tricarboxylate transporter permease [Candidatus Woesearchaeota archaeon]|nr:tripartite tricarboxylate transporter permease [Candidatus Woesearchaeota archaeon]